MSRTVYAALTGAALFLSFSSIAPVAQAADDLEVRACVKHVAEAERAVARRTTGDERRFLIQMLGRAKIACMERRFEAAYASTSNGMNLAAGSSTATAR
mgnify:CR=1 FL=1